MTQRIRRKTDDEIQIWKKDDPEFGKPVLRNGECVWAATKRVCDIINAHEDIIHFETFSQYKCVMKKAMMVIRESFNVERKRRQTSLKKRTDDSKTRTQRAKTPIANIKRGRKRKEET